MASDSKQPGMFDAFGPGKGVPPEPKKPSQPPSKPVDIKPPIPMPGRVKPEAQPSGAKTTPSKPVVPTLQEAKAIPPRPPEPKRPESKGITPVLPEAKRVTPAAAKPEVPPKPAVTPPASPVAAAPASMPGAPKPAPSVGLAKDAGGLGGQGDVHVMKLGQKSEVVFGLSYQALIATLVIAFAAIVVIVLLAVAIAGRGGDTSTKKDDGKSTTTDTSKSVTTTTGEFPPGTYYSVQALTVRNEPERLRELEGVEQFLKEHRVGAVVRRVNKRGDLVSLFAGAFVREHKSDAEVLAKRIQGLNYRGRYEFKTAQVVSIQ